MKKLKFLLALFVCGFVLLGLCSCFGVSQMYADKINNAAEKDEHVTYSEVLDTLGDDAVDITLGIGSLRAGVIVAVKGCESLEDITEKIENEEDVKGIVVTILGDKAMSATYKVITAEDLK